MTVIYTESRWRSALEKGGKEIFWKVKCWRNRKWPKVPTGAPLHVLPLTRVLCDPWWSQMRTNAPSSDLSNVLTAPAETHSAWFWCRSLAGLCGGKCLDDVRGSEQSIARALELYSPDFSVWVSGGIIVALQQSPLIQWVWQWAHVGFVSARLPVAFLSSPFTRAGSCL